MPTGIYAKGVPITDFGIGRKRKNRAPEPELAGVFFKCGTHSVPICLSRKKKKKRASRSEKEKSNYTPSL